MCDLITLTIPQSVWLMEDLKFYRIGSMAGNFHGSFPLPGNWLKGKVIGSGSFGTVHLAMNRTNGSLFVVKSAESYAGLESLQHEAKIIETLNSPFIIQCLGKEDSIANGEHRISLFMEYMAGGSLFDVSDKFGGSIHEQVIRSYTQQILRGLKYLHEEEGIVHCDLKCKNVLLGSSGNVKLSDFGCAKRVKDMKKNGNLTQPIAGTPLWMAPEVLRNEGLDYGSDIWSLGCTVIEMATGKPPWVSHAAAAAAAMFKIAGSTELPVFPSNFSRQGLDFLTKCLERNPKRRWTAAELLQHPFMLGIDDCICCSPASILDIGLCDYDSEQVINPLSTKCGSVGRKTQQTECGLELEEALEDWITVRSYVQI